MLCEESVSEFYKNKIEEEEKYTKNGPLKRVIYKDKLYESSMKYGVKNDFAGDDLYAINDSNTILHKYKNRLLVLVTNQCACECAYCFRQVNRRTSIVQLSIEEITKNVINYLKEHKFVKEVILSGGDPILLGKEKIEYFLQKISSETHIKDFRLHTRTIVYSPSLITEDIIELLAKYNIRLVFHIVHPYEICKCVENKITEIQKKGIRCYNQFPMLRGINDHIDIIVCLLYKLDNCGVRNLSIFVTDPLNCIEEYRVSIKRCYNMWQELETEYPAWMNSTKMVFDSAIGKVNIKDLLEYDEEKCGYWFKRAGEKIFFNDISKDIDVPGDKEIMLWRKQFEEVK